ncbi:MAG: polysaccharide deacetylase family protein [Saprospiraceae bacterium]|nr:polysaccharide deacetylase family protein [Saprospiraceae bacterium]
MDTHTILFFSEKLTNRVKYVAELIFQDLLGLSLSFTQDETNFVDSALPKINYSQTPLSEKLSSNNTSTINKRELFIKNHTLLFENQIISKHLEYDFSFIHQCNPLAFDFLAFTFLFVTRYEEYIAPSSAFDVHGRFPAHASIASKHVFLQKPIINQWVVKLNLQLKTLFPELQTRLPTYSFQPTFDIDMPWRYKHKRFIRTLGGWVKDVLTGKWSDVILRLQILRGYTNDPDFTFPYILDWHKQHDLYPIFFLLLGDYGEFDKNPNVQLPVFQAFLQSITQEYEVGLHPSYRSNTSVEILAKEKGRFERITNTPLSKSRQHFLKLRFPETYNNLETINVTEDYSLGYADAIGFRASIATPFRWYDLAKDECSDLIIHPFQVMDVTLKDYLNLSPDEALEQVALLIAETKKVGGTFITLWHNPSLSNTEGWANWRFVYEKIALLAKA